MNADDIYKVIENAVEKTVPPVVERVVNGKVRKVQETLELHMQTSQERHEELLPVIEALKFFQTGRKFAMWAKPLAPFLLFVGVAWVAFKKLFTP
jgi:hypothetical protein